MSGKKFPLRVIKGGFEPASNTTADELRERGYKIGDIVFARLTKPRNPGFHNLAHALGACIADNIESFEGMEAHKVIKRLQFESKEGCEEIASLVPGVGMVISTIPKSISWESMDQGEFEIVYRGICRHIAKTYWKELDADGVADVVESFMRNE